MPDFPSGSAYCGLVTDMLAASRTVELEALYVMYADFTM